MPKEQKQPAQTKTPDELNRALEQLARDCVNRWIEQGVTPAGMRNRATAKRDAFEYVMSMEIRKFAEVQTK